MATVLLQGAELVSANLQGAFLFDANLQEANLRTANLQEANLESANLQGAFLWETNLQGAKLFEASLQGAKLFEANLQGAHLKKANLQEAELVRTQLKGADLEGVTLGNEKQVGPRLADCQWGDVNLAAIEWSQVKLLGDEDIARQEKDDSRQTIEWSQVKQLLGDEDIARQEKDDSKQTMEKQRRLSEYEEAVRANRQLAAVLRNQGLSEDADRFAYRAQLCNLHLLQLKLPRLPQFGWLIAKPSDSNWQYLLLLPLSFALVFLSALALGMESSPIYSSQEGVLLTLGGVLLLVSILALLVIYQPLVRLLLASLLLVFCLGFAMFRGFSFLHNLLLRSPAWQLLSLSVLSLIFLVILRRWQKIKEWTYLGDYGRYLFSGALFLLAGYGYRPIRTLTAYLLVLSSFAITYFTVSQNDKALSSWPWYECLALSISSFHGRGFFPGSLPAPPNEWIITLALAEAVIGLFIELIFIATFTQRFLGK